MCISKMKLYSSGYPIKLKQCVKHEPTPSAIIIRYFCTPSGVFPCFKVNVMLRLSIEDLNLVKKYKMYFLFMIYQFFEKKMFKCVKFWLFQMYRQYAVKVWWNSGYGELQSALNLILRKECLQSVCANVCWFTTCSRWRYDEPLLF